MREPGTIWLTGLPCSGKTTLAMALKEELDKKGYQTVHLDGDVVRAGINKGLGFSSDDRRENLKRVAHMARDLSREGNVVIASFVSPTNELRGMVRKIIGPMWLVYVKCSLEECKKRDVKGMYKKAEKGEIKEFTGISASFEEPDEVEGFGIVFLEAMAAVKPIIASKSGGAGEALVGYDKVVFVDSGSIEEIAQGILKLLQK